jgi:purine-binding chemotaxis protein CheW
MRAAFDRAFAAPARLDTATKQDLLAIRVGTHAYALRLSEVSSLVVDKPIRCVHGNAAALLGIAGFRGAIVPVYGLRTLLGHPGTQPSRWLVIAAGASVAFAFDAFEGQLRLSADAILPQQPNAQASSCAREFIRTQDIVRPVLHLPSVLDAVSGIARPQTTPNEE